MPTSTTGVPPEWKRLGDLLTERRVRLGYRERTRFCTERGIDYRLVYDIEQARRANFTRGTIAALEVAYALRPGAIRAALAGGDLEAAAPDQPPLAAVPEPSQPPGDDLVSAVVHLLIQRLPASARDSLGPLWDLDSRVYSVPQKLSLLRALLEAPKGDEQALAEARAGRDAGAGPARPFRVG